MKKLIFLLFLILSATYALPQQPGTVTGKVSDENNVGIPGVSVQIKGTQQGTISNLDGDFTIRASSGDVLLFSFIGYVSQEVPVGDQRSLTIVMKETAYDMDEVVVIGYGSAAVKDLTGTIAVVRGEDLTKQAVPNIGQALQGRVAGVQVSNSGAPGSAPTIRIRGLGTVRSDASPLFVVDGVFVDDISYISPQQIENVTVL